tara:strand:+ start:310 stop:513 length:204 start_codon:yes stop_codon:yes gene_type:complete
MDWDLELAKSKLEDMIIVYEQEIQKLEIENKTLKSELKRLKSLLKYTETPTSDAVSRERDSSHSKRM